MKRNKGKNLRNHMKWDKMRLKEVIKWVKKMCDNRGDQMKWDLMKENGQKGKDEVRQVKKRNKEDTRHKRWDKMR